MSSTKESGILTLAAIRKVRGETQYLFNEKQAIFRLNGEGKAARETAALLREAARKKLPVKAQIDTREGVIRRATPVSGKELEEFRGNRILVENPEKTLRLDASSVDPTVFNIENYHRRVRCFRLCKRIIPNYKNAKKIFGGTFSGKPVHPLPVRERRLLRAGAQDALDHYDEISLLLRENIQLCEPGDRHAGSTGQQMGRMLRDLVVPRGAAGACTARQMGRASDGD